MDYISNLIIWTFALYGFFEFLKELLLEFLKIGHNNNDTYFENNNNDTHFGNNNNDAYLGNNNKDAYLGNNNKDVYLGNNNKDTYVENGNKDTYLIITVKDGENYIEDLLRSEIFINKYGKTSYFKQILVVDLNSVDNTKRIINNIEKQDGYVKLVDLEELEKIVNA